MDEVTLEQNCVHSISLILFEILTDAVPITTTTTNASQVAQIVCDGGLPDLSLLHTTDDRLYSILSSALLPPSPTHSITLTELHFQLNRYYLEVALDDHTYSQHYVHSDIEEKKKKGEDNTDYSEKEATESISVSD